MSLELKDLTFIIKTVARRDSLERLLKSIQKFHPGVAVLIGDDGLKPYPEVCLHGEKYFKLPIDCGLSAARNFLVRKARTPYVLLLDDDFEFKDSQSVPRLLKLVRTRRTDLAAGHLKLPDGRSQHWEGIFRENERGGVLYVDPKLSPILTFRGIRFHDVHIAHNYFVAKREDLIRNPWDSELKLHEHFTFFVRWHRAGLRCAFVPDSKILHWKDRPWGYLKLRNRHFRRLALERLGLSWIALPNGEVVHAKR